MGSSSRNSHGDVVNPLLKGFLTGQFHGLFHHYNRLMLDDLARLRNPGSKMKFNNTNKQNLKLNILNGCIRPTASLGIFEILRKRLRNSNEGRPLSVYQEGCCGFMAACATVFAWKPFDLAYRRVGIQSLSYTNWFSSLTHIAKNQSVLSMYKSSRGSMNSDIALYTGMLASYDRTLHYLTHTQALPYWAAQTSASIISGFFAAACSHPVIYMDAIIDTRLQMRYIPATICAILNPFGNFNFYTRLLSRFQYSARFCVVQYAIFEGVRRVEWIK
ncbi:mitochondrial dicarboxylate/tricarboxylate transporter DTC-like [Salvia miltiorrhiza]|uniref:mitochondrial dicarboxylate/tricarboxylate transporter DTC-like n=1 Tax=Salvia miltiorrhiza TaxID=226208 RepID=UPI0025AC2CF0|nr:mitochondrial dicarboxylate/tricarboxylate transporter DTC-like [Salvia miltiorrhiza]